MSKEPRGFAHPWFQIGFGALLVTASEVFLKRGAAATADLSSRWSWTGFSGLASPWVWGAILLILASFASWSHVLRYVPLSVAFPLSNVVHVLVPLASWVIIGEQISGRRWIGISLVVLGLFVVAQPAAQLEERL
jgi:drug/metabolite transporter (DMT)-like permease